MSVTVDPRLAQRRQQVQESWARRRLRWLIALLALVVLAGVGVALARSSWLAVHTISIAGGDKVDVVAVLAAHEVAEGVPTISVRAGEIERDLRADPWVAQVDVAVTWPGTVEITLLERTPAAWVQGPTAWWLLSADGVVLTKGSPPPGAPTVSGAPGQLRPGMAIDDRPLVGALEFLALLPEPLAEGASARVTIEGIEASVDGYTVLAGNHRDVAAKAATLVAMLDEGVEPGWVINLISPERPGIFNPQPIVEGTGEDVSSSDD